MHNSEHSRLRVGPNSLWTPAAELLVGCRNVRHFCIVYSCLSPLALAQHTFVVAKSGARVREPHIRFFSVTCVSRVATFGSLGATTHTHTTHVTRVAISLSNYVTGRERERW